MRVPESHHETDLTPGPITDEAPEGAVLSSRARRNSGIPDHDDRQDDSLKVLNESGKSEPKLRQIDEFLQLHGGRQRYYVDTGPVLERDFAALAGAGWHGKSTMLIHPELGTLADFCLSALNLNEFVYID